MVLGATRHPASVLVMVFVVVALALTIAPATANAAPPTAAPEMVSPSWGDVVDANPVFRWKTLAGAARYRVQVSTSATFSSLLYSAETPNTMATVPNALPLGTLYWRVAGMDSALGIGPYAESSFQRQSSRAPVLVAPDDDATLTYPAKAVLFRWQPLAGATSYRFEVDDADDFIGATAVVTANTSYAMTEPQTVGQPFYWRVQGLTGSGATEITSEWSSARTYSLSWPASRPVLLSPPDASLVAPENVRPVEDVVLDWQPVNGAALYHVQISSNGDWANNIADEEDEVHGTSYSPPAGLDNGHYFWRVRARDAKAGAPNEGSWSQEWQFTRGHPLTRRPTLLTPLDGDLHVTTPTFAWTPVRHASHYELQVGEDENFSPGTYATCYTNHTSYTPHKRIVPLTTMDFPGTCLETNLGMQIGVEYFWRVRAQDGRPVPKPAVNGRWSNTSSSDTYSFMHRASAVPSLIAPDDGATVSAPTLEWESVPGQGRYQIYVQNVNGDMVVNGTETFATSFTPPQLFANQGPFRWWVRTTNSTSGPGLIPALASTRTFSLTAPTDTAADLTLLSPSPGASFDRMPQMTWSPVTGATRYVVRTTAHNMVATVRTTGTHVYPSFTYPGATLTPNEYGWQVQAFNGSSPTPIATSEIRNFTIVPLANATYVGPCTAGVSCVVADTPTLAWNPVPRAGGYRVYIAADPDFTNIVREYTTVFTQLTPRESLVDSQAGQSYYWFVRPCLDPNFGDNPGCTPFNESVYPRAYRFRKRSAPVELVSPGPGATVGDEITFQWRHYLSTNYELGTPVTQEARHYRIQVSTVSDFATILDTAVVEQTTYTPFNKTYPDGPLFWRVQAIDGSGNNLTMSRPGTAVGATNPLPGRIVKSSPLVATVAPAHDADVTGVPAFQWKPRPFAATYELEVYKNGDTQYSPANKLPTAGKITKLTAWTPTIQLPAGDYAWRLRKRDVDDRPGGWTEGQTFSLRTISKPQLVAPETGEVLTNHSLLLKWSTPTRASRYRVEISQSPTFSSIHESVITVMPAFAPTRPFPDATYYWRVHVLDASNNILSTSAVWSFAKHEALSTALSMTLSATRVSEPGTVTITGVLTRRDTGAALAGRTVRLLHRAASSSTFTTAASAVSDFNGRVRFTPAPRQHWVYKLAISTSGPVVGSETVARLVRYQPVLSASLGTTYLKAGNSTRLNGALSPYFQGRTIYLQKIVSGRWTSVDTRVLGAPTTTQPSVIKFSFPLKPPRGDHHYRVLFPGRTNVNLAALTGDNVLRVQ